MTNWDLELFVMQQRFAAEWPAALVGDVDAVEVCLQLLSVEARLLGLDPG